MVITNVGTGCFQASAPWTQQDGTLVLTADFGNSNIPAGQQCEFTFRVLNRAVASSGVSPTLETSVCAGACQLISGTMNTVLVVEKETMRTCLLEQDCVCLSTASSKDAKPCLTATNTHVCCGACVCCGAWHRVGLD